MAKKKTQRKAKSFSEALGLEYLFNNTITDFFLGLILFFASVYVIIAMVSFLNTGAADQKYIGRFATGRMDQYRTTVSELLWLLGCHHLLLAHVGQLWFPCLPAAFVLRAGGLSTHACL